MRARGIGVSPGVAVGPALVVERRTVPVFRLQLGPDAVEAEEARLARAVQASRAQLQAIKDRLAREVGAPHAYIFDAHLLMLEDPLLVQRAAETIRGQGVNAEWALRTVAGSLHALFDGFADAYIRERRTDLDDVLGRLLLNLAGADDAPSLSRLPGSFVLVAEEMTPSEAAELDWGAVLAIVTETGSATHHAAILARSLGIPAVTGVAEATRLVPPGATVVVDGGAGEVSVDPGEEEVAAVRVREERDREEDARWQGTRALPCVTRDGVRVALRANVELADEVSSAAEYGAEGIGLFRSEFLLGRARRWPTEDRQYEVYRGLLETVAPHPVVVRTWDVGADEMAPGGPSSPNPALGERALRLVRRDPGPFRAQLRALFRAAVFGPLRVMFPFITGPADLRVALDLVSEAREELRRSGVAFAPDVPVGITIEVPSAAATADLLAPHVDFMALGTNDLVQYLLAVDRVDPRVSALYEPLHPAVLRAVDGVLRAGAKAHVPVSLCGEMAADPRVAVLLVGLGLRELSMGAGAVPRVKSALRAVSSAEAGELACRAMAIPTAAEIEAMLRRELTSAGVPSAGG
jgi:phosphotransferase system enzyme I (PtsI)